MGSCSACKTKLVSDKNVQKQNNNGPKAEKAQPAHQNNLVAKDNKKEITTKAGSNESMKDHQEASKGSQVLLDKQPKGLVKKSQPLANKAAKDQGKDTKVKNPKPINPNPPANKANGQSANQQKLPKNVGKIEPEKRGVEGYLD